jgi:hypothetical protein
MSWEAALARNSELTGADEGFWLSHQVRKHSKFRNHKRRIDSSDKYDVSVNRNHGKQKYLNTLVNNLLIRLGWSGGGGGGDKDV